MSNAVVSRLGQVNGTGQTDALFLQKFSGEILTAFNAVNVMLARHMVRTITEGRSASFPAVGLAAAFDHVPGTFLNGRVINQAERVITLDGLLVSDVFIANIDEAMNHFDVRSIYTKQIAEALSLEMDSRILRTAVLTARATNVVTGLPGGATLNSGPNVLTNASGALRQAIFLAAQTLDEKNVPDMGNRSAYMRPAQYYALAQDAIVTDRDFSASPGADIRTGKVYEVAGVEIVKTNNLPRTNVTTGLARYQGNFLNTAAVVMTPDACATLKLMDLAVEGEYQISRQGTLIVAKYAASHGVLRPEAAVELSAAV